VPDVIDVAVIDVAVFLAGLSFLLNIADPLLVLTNSLKVKGMFHVCCTCRLLNHDAPTTGYHAPHPAAMQPAMVAGAQPILPPAAGGHAPPAADAVGVPQARPDIEQSIRVGKNSADLLQEMLGPLSAPGADRAALQEPFVADLVQNCYRYVGHSVIGLEQTALVVWFCTSVSIMMGSCS
jgi:hypothetical protein